MPGEHDQRRMAIRNCFTKSLEILTVDHNTCISHCPKTPLKCACVRMMLRKVSRHDGVRPHDAEVAAVDLGPHHALSRVPLDGAGIETYWKGKRKNT